MRTKRVDWEEIKRLYESGTPVKNIAAKFGISKAYVCFVARRTGCRLRRPRKGWLRRLKLALVRRG